MAGSYPLPDGRILNARVFDSSGGDAPNLGPLWQLRIEGSDDLETVGHPLAATLADLLGHDVANDSWPTWIDELAGRIEIDASD